MTEATWATNELPEHGVSKSISTPPVWVSTSDLLSLFPALLLHIVRKDLWVGVRRSHELLKLFQVPIEKRGRGERETKGGSAREKSADKVRMQRMQPRGFIPLDMWALHMCHVSNLTENLTEANGMDHFDM
ncbi:unnamed protein product [Prunus armeniaca]|nr:hypothetical protein GBA52_020912 [Prunus armeniaca]